MSRKKRRQLYLPEIAVSASTGECTGLMPTPPLNDAELKAYQQIYSTALPAVDTEEIQGAED